MVGAADRSSLAAAPATGEREVFEELLLHGWREVANELGALRRRRFTKSLASRLPPLLIDAVPEGGLRTTAAPAMAAGVASRPAVAFRRRLDRRTLPAARCSMVFTSPPADVLASAAVPDLYRFRWQTEVAFLRVERLLRIGRWPHRDPRAGRSRLMAEPVAALLLGKLVRCARFTFRGDVPSPKRPALRRAPNRWMRTAVRSARCVRSSARCRA